MATIQIHEETFKKLESVSENLNYSVDELAEQILKDIDEEYIQYLNNIDEAIEELENNTSKPLTLEELFKKMDTW